MPDAAATSSLERRLARLERKYLRARRAAAVAGVVVLAGVAAAFAKQDPIVVKNDEVVEVRARRFVLTDGRKTRGLFATDVKGQPSFTLLDAEGRTRASLRLEDDEVLWTLLDESKENRLGLSVDTAGLPHIVLNDAAGRPRMHLSVNPAGRPNLLCRGDEGVLAAGIGLLDSGEPWLRPQAPPSQDGGK